MNIQKYTKILIRRLLPKGTYFSEVSNEKIIKL